MLLSAPRLGAAGTRANRPDSSVGQQASWKHGPRYHGGRWGISLAILRLCNSSHTAGASKYNVGSPGEGEREKERGLTNWNHSRVVFSTWLMTIAQQSKDQERQNEEYAWDIELNIYFPFFPRSVKINFQSRARSFGTEPSRFFPPLASESLSILARYRSSKNARPTFSFPFLFFFSSFPVRLAGGKEEKRKRENEPPSTRGATITARRRV